MDTSILEELGLRKAEIKVYVALLELGSSSAGHVLEKSLVQNSVMHRALNSLIEKGLISFILEGKRRIYQATNPENFHDFIEDKIKRFDEILPQLKQKQKFSSKETFGEIFKSKRGINQMYQTLLNCGGKEYNTFGGGIDFKNVMGDPWWNNLHSKRIDNKLPCRQVFDESVKEFGDELNKKELSHIRFLPKEYAQLQETIIIGEFVGIAIFTQTPYGILIKDKDVAEGYRKQFEILWNKAKK